jgi:hypothetical protein
MTDTKSLPPEGIAQPTWDAIVSGQPDGVDDRVVSQFD